MICVYLVGVQLISRKQKICEIPEFWMVSYLDPALTNKQIETESEYDFFDVRIVSPLSRIVLEVISGTIIYCLSNFV